MSAVRVEISDEVREAIPSEALSRVIEATDRRSPARCEICGARIAYKGPVAVCLIAHSSGEKRLVLTHASCQSSALIAAGPMAGGRGAPSISYVAFERPESPRAVLLFEVNSPALLGAHGSESIEAVSALYRGLGFQVVEDLLTQRFEKVGGAWLQLVGDHVRLEAKPQRVKLEGLDAIEVPGGLQEDFGRIAAPEWLAIARHERKAIVVCSSGRLSIKGSTPEQLEERIAENVALGALVAGRLKVRG